MKRWNITLPDDVSKELSAFPNKSRFIAETMREKLKKMKRAQLDKLLIEGYRKSREEAKIVNEDWETATLKNWEP